MLPLLLLACMSAPATDTEDPVSEPGEVCLSASPSPVEWAELARGETASEVVTLSNDCGDTPTEAVTLIGVSLAQGTVAVDDPGRTTLEPGATAEVTVQLDGVETGSATDVLTALFDDGSQLTVPVSAEVVGPVIDVDPSLALGSTTVGCTVHEEIPLANEGTTELSVRVTTDDDSVTVEGTWPLILEPSERSALALAWLPREAGALGATVTISSDDALQPEVTVAVGGEATDTAWHTETFSTDEGSASDILLTVDQSMVYSRSYEFLDAITPFVAALEGHDFRLAAVSMDDGCILGSALFSEDGDADIEELFEVQANVLAEGGYAGDTERSWTLLGNALDQRGSSECNEDLLRDDTHLVTISISDEDEQSEGSWTERLSQVLAHMEDTEDVRMHAIAGPTDGSCSNAGTGDNYDMAATVTGGTLVDICGGIEAGLVTLADESFWFDTRLQLQASPEPDTLTVTIDGTETTDFTLDGDLLTLDEEPESGVDIVITYAEDGSC